MSIYHPFGCQLKAIFKKTTMRPTFLLFLYLTAAQLSAQADRLFWNGPIYTLEAPGERVEALVTVGERIVFTGTWAAAQALIDTSTEVIDLGGKTLLPGFTDSHVHPLTGGMAMLGCDLTGILEPDSMLVRIQRYAAAHPEPAWLRVSNFWLASFPDGNPRKEWLDDILPDRPVYVSSGDGHSAWVNSRALDLAGITAATPDPVNGVIERDPDSGEPTGTLREEAMSLVGELLPAYTPAENVAGLRQGLALARSLGITNLVEADASEAIILAYLELAEREELTSHVSVSIFGDLAEGAAGARAVLALNEKYRSRLPSTPGQRPDLSFDQVKYYMDGVVEGKTGAMLEPYAGGDNRGIANASPAAARAAIALLDSAGIQLHVHAIGDRGIRMTLDAFEYARQRNGSRDSRHHIAHLHVIHPADIPRFAALGVIANFQAVWATPEDTYMTEFNEPYLGPERSEWQYPIGTVARTGARLAFGSDWDVDTMNPFRALQVAVTRRGPDSTPRKPWTPQHLVDRYTVVRGYTQGGAYLTFRELETGTLTPGKLADLIVVDQDIFTVSPFEIYRTQVLATVFRGAVVYGSLVAR
jgi:hypothetical protein